MTKLPLHGSSFNLHPFLCNRCKTILDDKRLCSWVPLSVNTSGKGKMLQLFLLDIVKVITDNLELKKCAYAFYWCVVLYFCWQVLVLCFSVPGLLLPSKLCWSTVSSDNQFLLRIYLLLLKLENSQHRYVRLWLWQDKILEQFVGY